MSRHTIIKAASALLVILALLMAVILWQSAPPAEDPPPDDTPPAQDELAPALVAALQGTISDQDGDPIEGVSVALSDSLTVETDALGAYRFDTIPDDAKTLTITPPEGFVLPEHLGRLPLSDPLPQSLDLTLSEPARIRGTIVASGRPLKDASISILYLDAMGPMGSAEPFTLDGLMNTAERGEFSFELLPGRIQLLVETADYPFYQSSILTLEAARTLDDVRIDLDPNTSFSIELVNASGESLDGDVIVYAEDAPSTLVRMRTTGGQALVQSMPEGKPVTIIAHARGYTHGYTTVTPEVGQPAKATVTLEPASQNFSGIVLGPDYSPIADATVLLTAPGTRQKVARTNKEGRFLLDGPPNLNTMQAQVLSARNPPSDQASLTRGEEAMFLLARGGFISGQVVSARGTPVTRYKLEVVDFRPESGPRYNRLTDFGTPDITDPQGTFSFGPLRPGTYYLKASPTDLASAESEPISVSAAQTTSNITITVQQPGRVTGRVTDAQSGQPLARATVALTSTNRATISTQTDEDGRYTLEDVPPGRQSVRVTMSSYTTQFAAGVEVAPGSSTTQDLLMEKGDAKQGFSFYGIGATLEKGDDGLHMRQVMQGSPAEQAGARDGDMILSIDGKNTDNMRVIDAVELIRGQEDTDVQLDIDRPGEGRLTLTVTRGKVEAKR